MLRPFPRISRFVVAACLLLVFQISTAADFHAPAEYTLREWHVSDGLPSDEVNSVVQDEEGYLWIATTSGVVRFDGTTLSPIEAPGDAYTRGMIHVPPGRSPASDGLLAPKDLEMVGSKKGRDPKAGYYVRTGGTFRLEEEPAFAGKNIRSVHSQPDGALWFGSEDGTILRRLQNAVTAYDAPAGPAGKRIPTFATDGEGRLWASIGTAVVRFDGTAWVAFPIAQGGQEIRVGSSRTGGPWIFTRDQVLKLDGDKVEKAADLPELLGAHFIQTSIEDTHGYVWIGTRSQGLFRIKDGAILHVPTAHEDVVALCEDNEGGIWVGTNGGGLNRLRPRVHRLFDKSSGLKENFSYTAAEDQNGVMWFANRDGGVARVIGDEVDPISRRANWRQFSAMSVFPAPDGGMWITSGIAVFRTDPAMPERLQRIAPLNNFRMVRSTFVSKSGDYWMSHDPDHVVRWRDGKATIFGSAEGLEVREVRGIAEDASGAIWVGAADGRLFRLRDERFERVPLPGSERLGSLQFLHFDEEGTLFIGTTRQGFMVLPKADPSQARTIGTDQGLPNDNVTEILSDDFDRYWIATRGGIYWLHRPQLRDFMAGKTRHVHAIILGRDEGVPDLSCLGMFQPSAWKARDGRLWFATRRGVIRIDPSLMIGSEAIAPVTLSGITTDGRAASAGPSIELNSRCRKTELHLSVLNLANPERVLLRYRLDGFDDDWLLLKTGRTVAYPRLPPGHYIFRAQASNGNGIWNDQSPLLDLYVSPPLWQTWWAQFIYLLCFAAVVTVLVRFWSHRRLRMRLERLEREKAVERERTRIAQNIHDDLGASLTRISLLTQSAVHENPAQAEKFERIYEAAHAITRSMDEIVWAVNPKCDDAESLVYYVSNFAQGFLGAAGVRCRLDLPKTVPPLHLSSQVRHNLFLCCKEALNNVVKHARATEVSISFSATAQVLEIGIADNGRGVDAAAVGDRASLEPWRAGGGNGLKNMRQRMAEAGGSCTFSERLGGGTVATFILSFQSSPK